MDLHPARYDGPRAKPEQLVLNPALYDGPRAQPEQLELNRTPYDRPRAEPKARYMMDHEINALSGD